MLAQLMKGFSWWTPNNLFDSASGMNFGSFHTFPVHDGGNHYSNRNAGEDCTHANYKYHPWPPPETQNIGLYPRSDLEMVNMKTGNAGMEKWRKI